MQKKHYLAVLFLALVSCISNPVFANGKFWQSTNGPFGGRVNDLQVNSSGHIFAATGGNGIFRSTDQGTSWEPLNNGLTITDVYCLLINGNDDMFCGTVNGIFFSQDDGITWKPVAGSGFGAVIISLVMMPGDVLFAGTNTGVFRSTDYGVTWQEVNTGLSFLSVSAMAKIDDTTLFVAVDYDNLFKTTNNGDSWQKIAGEFGSYSIQAIAKSATGTIFVSNQGGVFRSTDSGASWTSLQYNSNQITGYSLFFDSSGNLFVGQPDHVLRSTDDGDNWTVTSTVSLSSNFLTFAALPGNYLFSGSENGVYRSIDAGLSWHGVNYGLHNVAVQSLAADDNNYLYAASREDGIFRKTQPQSLWVAKNQGLPTSAVMAIFTTAQGELLAATNGYGIYRSTDQAENWSPAKNGLPNLYMNYNDIRQNSTGTLFCSTGNGIYSSSDNAQSWQFIGLANKSVSCLAISMNDDIFAGTNYSGVFRSKDGGTTWEKISAGIENLDINRLLIDETKQLVYAGTNSGLFKMPIDGASWESMGFEFKVISAITFNSYGDLVIGTLEWGAYFSKDGGINWEVINDGLTNTTVLDLFLDKNNNLVAGTGGGVFLTNFSGGGAPMYAPKLISVKDVPADQGGKVTLKWLASSLDKDSDIAYYSIWRALPDETNSVPDGWEWITDMPAHGFPVYSYTAGTLFDSTATIDGKHFFMVSAHTGAENIFYDSNFEDGYSIDNLAPGKPQNLAAKVENTDIVLNWNANSETDLKAYYIYSSSDANIDFPQMQPLGITSDTTFTHLAAPAGEKIYYTVFAVDLHGNISKEGAQVTAEIATGVRDEYIAGFPQEFRLYQNHPNPFNPATTITFDVPVRGFVTIRVIDYLGREISVLQNGVLAAGRYSKTWSAQDQPSGVYFYQLTIAGDSPNGQKLFQQTKKMMLIK